MKTNCLLAILALASVGAAFAADSKPVMTATECEVWNRERSFAASVDNHDLKAFAEHVHVNAVFSAAAPNPQRGREAIVNGWAELISGKGTTLKWQPQYVSIGTDTNVAMSRGPFALKWKNDKGDTEYGIGTFTSVWIRKDASSPWYVVLDGGGPPPTPATLEEVKKHLAAAPATCPRPKM